MIVTLLSDMTTYEIKRRNDHIFNGSDGINILHVSKYNWLKPVLHGYFQN